MIGPRLTDPFRNWFFWFQYPGNLPERLWLKWTNYTYPNSPSNYYRILGRRRRRMVPNWKADHSKHFSNKLPLSESPNRRINWLIGTVKGETVKSCLMQNTNKSITATGNCTINWTVLLFQKAMASLMVISLKGAYLNMNEFSSPFSVRKEREQLFFTGLVIVLQSVPTICPRFWDILYSLSWTRSQK